MLFFFFFLNNEICRLFIYLSNLFKNISSYFILIINEFSKFVWFIDQTKFENSLIVQLSKTTNYLLGLEIIPKNINKATFIPEIFL